MSTSPFPPMTEETVRELRVWIRKFKNTVAALEKSRYTSMVNTSLEKAAMWAGKLLEVLGTPYPYDSKTAGPIADSTDEAFPLDQSLASSNIAWLRSLLQEPIERVLVWAIAPPEVPGRPLELGDIRLEFIRTTALRNIYSLLTDARMDLGLELGAVLHQEKVTHQKPDSHAKQSIV